MTNEEKQEIISSVIQSLQTNSATIDQLSEVESCSEGDFIELNKGRKISAENLAKDVSYEDVKAAYDKYYDKEYFVRVLPKDVCPETRWVEGSNFVDIGFKIEPRTNRIIAMGALDNLVKGAAGQAVQNMNLLFCFEENEGLKIAPMFP